MSPPPRARVLVVDDEPLLRRSLARVLLRGFDVLTAEDGASALGLLATTRVDVVLLDLGLPALPPPAAPLPRRSEPPPGLGGADLLARLRVEHPEVEVVAMADPDQSGAPRGAVTGGAFALVMKLADLEDAVTLAVERAVERRRLIARLRAMERRDGDLSSNTDLLGASSRVQELIRKAMGLVGSSTPILITGERGVGKELLARAMHRRSPRADRPFIALSLASLPQAQIEEELFGGAHTPGALATAGEGTLLLSEVEALPLHAQVRLLGALERGEIEAAPSAQGRRFRARLLASTTVDLRERVVRGLLREDLAYRLGVVSLHIPSLRRRREDIPLLAHHFLRRHGQREGRDVRRISAEAMRLLREYPWPGNVQELEHAVEHATLMARGEAITPGDLPSSIAGPERRHGSAASRELAELPYVEARERSIDAFEQDYVATLLERTGGNVSEAARQAGMDRANFRRLKKRVERKDDALVEGRAREGQGGGEGLPSEGSRTSAESLPALAGDDELAGDGLAGDDEDEGGVTNGALGARMPSRE
ncbi:sigma-54-dependent transcriptional regulator [Chondromyces crocatus]|uniref:Fis family transcriptional regulator n=1 Tax=Chondromyces crocatus TaxID=52 RepID=A0A0K1EMA3_CHOCO|nr:sigma-54 dependent transcriptional regulator [Chondromyces crocatus]AKT41994.1 Fis family transcriptional regulator [Chondromyces crocatus]